MITYFRSFLSLKTKIRSLSKLFMPLNMLVNTCNLTSVLAEWGQLFFYIFRIIVSICKWIGTIYVYYYLLLPELKIQVKVKSPIIFYPGFSSIFFFTFLFHFFFLHDISHKYNKFLLYLLGTHCFHKYSPGDELPK